MEFDLVGYKFVEIGDRKVNAEDEEGDKVNYIYEGDNLECLNILEEKYLGAIDIIYIDPPYNTKKDFIYQDTFEEGKWNIFMKERLSKAKKMLSKDGAIFISIDENEYSNLKTICDEIFKKSNYIATIIRDTKSQRNQATKIKVNHEYLLVYAYNKGNCLKGLKRKLEDNKDYKNLDDDIKPWKASELTVRWTGYPKYDIPYLNDLNKYNRKAWKYTEAEFKNLWDMEKKLTIRKYINQ